MPGLVAEITEQQFVPLVGRVAMVAGEGGIRDGQAGVDGTVDIWQVAWCTVHGVCWVESATLAL